MSGVPRRMTILTPDGDTALPEKTSTVSEAALRSPSSLETLSVVLGAGEIPDGLATATLAQDWEIVVTYYLSGGDTRTYSGPITDIDYRNPHFLVTFTPES